MATLYFKTSLDPITPTIQLDGIKIDWGSLSAIDGYELLAETYHIYRTTTSAPPADDTDIAKINGTQYIDKPPTAGTYYYWIAYVTASDEHIVFCSSAAITYAGVTTLTAPTFGSILYYDQTTASWTPGIQTLSNSGLGIRRTNSVAPRSAANGADFNSGTYYLQPTLSYVNSQNATNSIVSRQYRPGGNVLSIPITNGGSGYSSVPTVTVSLPQSTWGVRATAGCSRIVVNSFTGGSGYTTAPTVTFRGGGAGVGSVYPQTEAVATITGGVVTAITITTWGYGYSSTPTIEISAPPSGGTQATATAVFSATIQAIVIFNRGYGYTSAPTVTLSGGNGTGLVLGTPVIGDMPIGVADGAGYAFSVMDSNATTSNTNNTGTLTFGRFVAHYIYDKTDPTNATKKKHAFIVEMSNDNFTTDIQKVFVVSRDRFIVEAPTKMYEQTIARLAVRANVLGDTCIITDGAFPNRPIFFDGLVWRYFADNNIVS